MNRNENNYCPLNFPQKRSGAEIRLGKSFFGVLSFFIVNTNQLVI